MFTSDPILGNVDLRARDFHGEPYYDVPALTNDQHFKDSMRLITQYSLLPFMTPHQFYYPRVVLEFYHTMTSREVLSRLELRFSIDGRPGVLRAADITAALGLPAELENSGGYRGCPQPSQRDGPLSRSRYYSGTRTLPQSASATDALSRPPAPDQLIPTTTLCSAQGSYTRGSVPDLRGILV